MKNRWSGKMLTLLVAAVFIFVIITAATGHAFAQPATSGQSGNDGTGASGAGGDAGSTGGPGGSGGCVPMPGTCGGGNGVAGGGL